MQVKFSFNATAVSSTKTEFLQLPSASTAMESTSLGLRFVVSRPKTRPNCETFETLRLFRYTSVKADLTNVVDDHERQSMRVLDGHEAEEC